MSQERPPSSEHKDPREDLKALAELLNLTIEREAMVGMVPTIVVKNTEGKEINIGIPNDFTPGVLPRPLTTGKIEGVKLQALGDGPWLYEIVI